MGEIKERSHLGQERILNVTRSGLSNEISFAKRNILVILLTCTVLFLGCLLPWALIISVKIRTPLQQNWRFLFVCNTYP